MRSKGFAKWKARHRVAYCHFFILKKEEKKQVPLEENTKEQSILGFCEDL
jgi:hypothetical protein